MSMEGDFFLLSDNLHSVSFVCISVVFTRFSPKFVYVVAETVCYQQYDIYFWFRWWDHGENFDWKWEVRIGRRLFQIYVLCVCGSAVIYWCGRSTLVQLNHSGSPNSSACRISSFYLLGDPPSTAENLLISSESFFLFIYFFLTTFLLTKYLKNGKFNHLEILHSHVPS